MVFHWSLNDSKSPHVFRTALKILADLNNIVFWMVSTRVLISSSSSFFNNPFMTLPNASITIGITVTFMFHGFFSSLARSRYLSLFSFSFNFTLWSAGKAKYRLRLVHFFLLSTTILVVWPRLDNPFVSQNHREF